MPLLFAKRYNACCRPMWQFKSKPARGRFRMKPITPEKSKLGFVGIGYMGRPIARRLLESGFKLTAYDRDHGKAEELVRYGGSVAKSVSELFSGCNVILSCLPSDEAVLDIYRGPDGAFANTSPGSVIIDMSTVYPETSRELSKLGSERGIAVLDVTISGSVPAAESIFRVLARKYFYLGPSGSGATMKLVVNTLLGTGMQAIAEAVALGEKAGLDR